MQLKVAPSKLESYRLFLTEDWMTKERFVDQITKPFEQTPAMALGTAVHEYIETGKIDPELKIDTDSIDEVVGDIAKLDPVYEMRGSAIFSTMYGEVVVNTITDCAIGNKLLEWKTTSNSLQMGKYVDSIQWKLMMHTLGFPAIEYRVMQLKLDKKTGITSVHKHDSVEMYWSDSLLAEIKFLIDAYIDFHITQGLTEYITIKQAA